MTTTARIYVGTYAKYNEGSIKGAWLDLEDYSDKEDFLEAAAALHSDESDPELMFQDMEGIPEGMASESHISDDVWEWLKLDEQDREVVRAYRECIDGSENDFDSIMDKFQGTADSERDYAEQYCEDSGTLDSMPDNLKGYFDYDAFARDLFMSDLSGCRHDGDLYVFSNC